jgi:hypothetical protein
MKLWRRVQAGGPFSLTIDGQNAGRGELAVQEAVHDEDLDQWRLYAEDLQALQEFCEQEFPLPEEISARERIMLRVGRLLLDGHCVISPLHVSLPMTLTGQDDDTVRAVLSGEPGTIAVTNAPFQITIAGRSLDLGRVSGFHTQVVAAEGRQEALAALDAGRGKGARVVLRPLDGEHYRLYLPSVDPHQPLIPTPLGLPGYPEPT